MFKYSIIIPCYNSALYLEETIAKLLNTVEARNDIEIICIDDGSVDNTSDILASYANKISFMEYYSKVNGGVSSARNYGILKASGEYILFLDSDDSYINDPFSAIDLSKSSSFFFFGYQKEIGNTGRCKIYKSDTEYCSSREVDSVAMLSGIFSKKISINICAVAISRKLLLEENIYFNEKAAHCEDLDFLIRTIMKSKSFEYLDGVFFVYRFREGSAVNSVVSSKQIDKISLFENLRFEIKNNYSKDLLSSFDFYVATVYILLMVSVFKYKIEAIDQVANFMKAGSVIFDRKLSYPTSKLGVSVKIYQFLFRILPFNFKLKIMNLFVLSK